ncbi:MAG: MYG1 family protein [Candidatus Paceibacterota bacterium]|jgi:uncharacterized UPF0160 family protein
MFSRKPLIVTHNNQFHPDDVCAVATLHILLRGKYTLVRTREQAMFDKADYVVDVGGIHDASRQRFDHHQKGGAGERQNGIPYAAFGLVWKEYGTMLTGSEEGALKIDEEIVAPGDARDNGFEIIDSRVEGIKPYEFADYLFSFNPSWNEPQDFDGQFGKAVAVAVPMLERAIRRAVSSESGKKFTEEAYQKATDKRIIELDGQYPWSDVLMSHPEPIFMVRAAPQGSTWGAKGVRIEKYGYALRKDFPAEWAGLSDADLARVSGVPDATFCHNKRFLAVAKSREGALALARKAIDL